MKPEPEPPLKGTAGPAEPDEPAEEESEPDDGGPLGAGLPWVEQRAEIAEEPGNHGRFALGCTAVVVLALAAFYLLRVFYLR